jgi:hypothetical protein
LKQVFRNAALLRFRTSRTSISREAWDYMRQGACAISYRHIYIYKINRLVYWRKGYHKKKPQGGALDHLH